MDWTNPLTYGVLLAVATTVGAVTWKIFWWVAKIDPLPEGLRELAAEIRADIKQILLRLTPVVDRASPVRLNDLGKRIARSLRAYDWAKKIAPSLLPEVQSMQDFQIDAFSDQVVSLRLGNEWPERIAVSAYEHGIDPGSVREVLRVVLRDELIERVEKTRTEDR